MDLKLTGKTALVTGSTAGIGLAIAQRCQPARKTDPLSAPNIDPTFR
ncbi:hypothetical protein [Sphingomonas sp. IC081]|nr:hypothetical protein [Sphingomonas sp. IC081]